MTDRFPNAVPISNPPPKVWAVFAVAEGIGGSNVLIGLHGSIEGADRYIRGSVRDVELIMVELKVNA